MTIRANKRYETVNETGWITVFTPTYNRVKYLSRIKKILNQQTNQNFVWILVNDGSNDDTDDVAIKMLESESLPMLYISKENGGKHSAFKVALELCKTDYFLFMDDDDTYSQNSIDFFLNKWHDIEKGGKKDIGSIRTLTKRADGSYIVNFQIAQGDVGKEYDESSLDENYIHNRRMENWVCYNTSKLRSVPLFPDNYWLCEKHHYYSEGIWQGRFARRYRSRYIYIALREYNDSETESITRGQFVGQKAMDSFINCTLLLNEQHDYISKNLIRYFAILVKSGVMRWRSPISLIKHIKHCTYRTDKFFLFVLAPVSFMMCCMNMDSFVKRLLIRHKRFGIG